MIELRERNVVFSFPADWQVRRYDALPFYRQRFQKLAPLTKAVDFVAMPPSGSELWLIEAKDYTLESRDDRSRGPIEIEVAHKARDTLAGLMAAALHAQDDDREFANLARRSRRYRVVLHLEVPSRADVERLHLQDRAELQWALKARLKSIDPKPKVVSTSDMLDFPWTTRWQPMHRGQNR